MVATQSMYEVSPLRCGGVNYNITDFVSYPPRRPTPPLAAMSLLSHGLYMSMWSKSRLGLKIEKMNNKQQTSLCHSPHTRRWGDRGRVNNKFLNRQTQDRMDCWLNSLLVEHNLWFPFALESLLYRQSPCRNVDKGHCNSLIYNLTRSISTGVFCDEKRQRREGTLTIQERPIEESPAGYCSAWQMPRERSTLRQHFYHIVHMLWPDSKNSHRHVSVD
ncbi:hypothetical protein J6590_012259 [Homalodisca vitripennis]|nr:hypothetical protein J6590_012259 [Homalodisca vitripennis]